MLELLLNGNVRSANYLAKHVKILNNNANRARKIHT